MRFSTALWHSLPLLALSLTACSGGSDQNPSGGSSPTGDDATLKGIGDGELPGLGASTKGAVTGAAGASASGATTGLGISVPSISMGSGAASSGSVIAPSAATGTTADPGTAPTAPPTSTETTVGSPQVLPGAGTLTAGAWDDNRNFDRFLSYRSKAADEQLGGLLPFSLEELQAAHARALAAPAPKQRLDISLVLDTTGSMSDEIKYLQTEFRALSDSIRSRYPDAEQRWSLVAYRDQGDAYVVRWIDFRSDAEEFNTKLAAQAAEGGGDEPEAMDQALDTAGKLSWRTSPNAARLLFLVADAPHHANLADKMKTALVQLSELGVQVYPVAGSGASPAAEASLRSSAMVTGGRYLFLTDDSGFGGGHAEPTIPCYFVTHLNDAITRMVDIEMSGVYHEPAAAEILRTGGDPKSGACTLTDGQLVQAY